MRTVEIPLPDDVIAILDAKARSAGLEREVYIRALLSTAATGEPTISEVLLPFRQQVAASGISEDELDRLFSDAREEYHRGR
jgi:hypothetical protein